jgi:thiol-disulfide isomerase/thioredoxin
MIRAPSLPALRSLRVAVLIAAAVVAGVLIAGLNRPGPPEVTASGEPVPLPAAGELPSVSWEDFLGMVAGQRGKPVVVNIWASWCAPCRTEMPLLQQAAGEYSGRAVVLGVASKDDHEDARRFLEDLGIDYPNVFDASGDVRVRLDLTAYPTTYVFSTGGELTARVVGGVSEQHLAALIEDALR